MTKLSKRPMKFDDFLDMKRAGRPRVSPDGTYVVFAAAQPDQEKNRNISHLYRVPIGGGEVIQLTQQGTAHGGHAFSPDGKWIAFNSNRGGSPQVWVMPTDGGEARQVTDLKLGARGPVWFPDGKRLLVVSTVYRDTNDQDEIKKREEKIEKEKPGHRMIDGLMFRHWDEWTEDKLDHLFVVDVATGEARDLTPGPYPVPPRSLTGEPDYAVSPDGKEVAFTCLMDDAQAVSTAIQIYTVPARGGKPKRISVMDGAHAFPVYSPDGGRMAFCGMRRAGYEADQHVLQVYDRKTKKVAEVAPKFKDSAGAPVWSPNGKQLYFAAQEKGRMRLFGVPARGGVPKAVTGRAVDHDPAISPDGKWLVFGRESLTSPPEIYRASVKGGAAKALTKLNREVLAKLEMNEAEDFWYEGAQGARVHGMILKPPGFKQGKKYPVVFMIHGGPQGMFGLDFHERWNTQLFSSPGYVTVMINPRGSTGYGQDFVDAIRFEWGGACYEDLERGFDYVLKTYPFCNPRRTTAIGASFGGYMVNWIAGHSDRFRCLVSHDGIFNTEMMNWATDELWFTEWEFGGLPWESAEEYRKWSPHLHVEKMKTPMLVVQGEQDFRCTVNESLSLFTALQRRSVPSKLLYFKDEGHWVLKPQNRRVWWDTVLGWLKTYLKG